MGAFRIFSRFAELLDIKVTRASAKVLQLNTDGSVSEVGVASAATANTIAKRDASGNISFAIVNSEGVATSAIDVTNSMSYGADATFSYTAGTSRTNHLAALGALPAADGTATNLTLSGTLTFTAMDSAAALALRNAAGIGPTDYSANVKVTTLEAVTLLKSPWLVVTSSAILMGNGAGAFKARNTSDTADANFSAGNLTASGAIITTPGARSGPGAVPITVSSVALTTTGVADALTLANGTNGQILTISHVSRGGGTGTAVLTPTTTNGFTTITFTATGDSVTLQYHTTGGWHVVGSHGVAIA